MRNDFCAFILTHGRPDRVHTYKTLQRAGYTGKVYIVIDDEDKTADEYRRRYGDKVLQFSKAAIAETFDEGDNFQDRRAIIYARNACWDLARQVGCRYFIQLDDDYSNFALRFDGSLNPCYLAVKKRIDDVLSALVQFLIDSRAHSIAMCQGGDMIGGPDRPELRRKCMNSFVCDTQNHFQFFGRINEDVNTYTAGGRSGLLFFTVMHAQLVQANTQTQSGGMTGLYLDSGTYIKSFYSVMYCPSAAKIGSFGDPCRWGNAHYRLHHKLNWNSIAPKILREDLRKPRTQPPHD